MRRSATAIGRSCAQIWVAHGGREQGTEGDSFFVAFSEASTAVEAAVAGQRALLAEPWPDEVDIRVRMGLNSGGAELSGDSLVGLGINRAARIAAAGPRRPDPGLRAHPRPPPGRARGGRDVAGSRGAPPQGSRWRRAGRAGHGPRPASRLPAAALDRCPIRQPARPADDVRRARRRTRGGCRPPRANPGPDPYRPRRHGQDQDVARAGDAGGRRLRRRRLVRPARADPRREPGRPEDLGSARAER